MLITDFFTWLYLAVRPRVTRKNAQGALEYMAMVVAMVVLIYAGFKIAGTDIFNEASCFVKTVIASGTCS